MPLIVFLYTIIFIEGYAVLAAELIALRNLISYVGNSSEIISIIIAAVLLPLAAGYYRGAILAAGKNRNIRRRLIWNFTFALCILGPGLSVALMDSFFQSLREHGITALPLKTALYALVFIIPPVFLLGQTIPLLGPYIKRYPRSFSIGKILFWSTLGSCFGALFTTLIVMPAFGVHVAVLLVVLGLIGALALMRRRLTIRNMLVPLMVLIVCLILNSGFIFRANHIYYQNAYNVTQIVPQSDGGKVLNLNKIPSSYINPSTDKTSEYIEKAEASLLPAPASGQRSRAILVIGAGGFTFGLKDTVNSYTYVDIDPDLKKLAEDHFLGRPLTPNKSFVPQAARSYLVQALADKKKFDVIYLDAFNGNAWVPEDLVTQEFFMQIRSILKPDGVLGVNMVIDPTFRDQYSYNLDQTFRSVFPVTLHIPVYDIQTWSDSAAGMTNMLYLAYNEPASSGKVLYTDDRNQAFWDKNRPRAK